MVYGLITITKDVLDSGELDKLTNQSIRSLNVANKFITLVLISCSAVMS